MTHFEDFDDRQWNGTEIAIVGLSCRFPGARDAEQFWRNLREGVESITFFDDEEMERSPFDAQPSSDPAFVQAAPVLEDADRFDASFFGLTPREAEIMDPQQRVFLECAWHALEDAGCDPAVYGAPIGVFAGARTNTYIFNLFSNRSSLATYDSFQIGLGNDLAFLPNRVSYKLDLSGPSVAVHTACSTSLVAVHLARQSLLIDECRMALAGGVAINVPQKTGYLYQPGSIVSPDGHCRTFDAQAQGTLFGSGVGVVALKRLEDAVEDGDHIYAILRGAAVNNDGALRASFTAPGVQGQTEVILDALADAGVPAESIGYVEAHGTGTSLGDPIEIRALTKAFRESTQANGFCAIGSVKSNIGHLDAAAGMAGLVKTVLALHHRELPPSLHFTEPNPQIDFASSPFRVQTEREPWTTENGPRRAALSSFGVGGTNAHLILEQAPPKARPPRPERWRLLPLSARTDTALEAATDRLVEHLEKPGDIDLADVAYTLQRGRKAMAHRRTVVARTPEEAAEALRERDAQRSTTDFLESGDRPLVFLFPGGGAQHVGMGRELYEEQPVFRREMDRCAEILEPVLGLDLRDVLFPATETEEAARRMEGTALALPALFAVEVALARLWMSWGVEPEAMIGHSLGEYAAAHLAGVFSLEDALSLVALRGRLFETLPEGAMLSVALGEESLRELLPEGADVAAINSPERAVASGPVEVIEALAAALEARDVDHRRLRIDVAAHSALVEPILDELRSAVAGMALQEPEIPFLSNVTGTWIEPEEAVDPEYWVRHLRSTVRFSEGVRELLLEPTVVMLEVGPGRTLSTLAREHEGIGVGDVTALASMRHPEDQRADGAYLLLTLGHLWTAGIPIEWEGLYEGEPEPGKASLPPYPFERQRYWIEPGEPGDAMAAAPGKRSSISEWFHVSSYRPSVPPVAPELEASEVGDWLILDEGEGLGEALARRVEAAGGRSFRITTGDSFARHDETRFTLPPGEPEGYRSVVEAIDEVRGAEPAGPLRVAHLWNVGGDGELTFQEAQDQGYYSLLFLSQALAARSGSEPVSVLVASTGLHAISGHEAPTPEKAPLLAPVMVISQEHENLTLRSVDLAEATTEAAQETAARHLYAETTTDASERIVAYRGPRRWVHAYEPLELTGDQRPERPLKEGGCYLITGGLGGVGLILSRYLADRLGARLALVGRTPLPDRESWDAWLREHGEDDRISRRIRTVRELEDLGSEVLVLAADVADADALRQAVDETVDRFGPLDGVLHAAGETSGESLYKAAAEVGREETEAQFQPKGYGLYALEQALEGRQPGVCVLFSSNAAVLGGLGFVTYAAANLFMDAFATDRSIRTGVPWVSANWDPWPEETRKYSDVQTSMDQYAMTLEESGEAFRRVACVAPMGQVVVATGDLPARHELWIERAGAVTVSKARSRPATGRSYVAPRTEVESKIAAIWEEVMGVEQVGVKDNFFDLGGHSLLATRLVSRLRDELDAEIPLGRFFAAPTVAGLATIVEAEAPAAEEEGSAEEELLEEVLKMSEEEARQELEEAPV